jgi:hypothetical protein
MKLVKKHVERDLSVSSASNTLNRNDSQRGETDKSRLVILF